MKKFAEADVSHHCGCCAGKKSQTHNAKSKRIRRAARKLHLCSTYQNDHYGGRGWFFTDERNCLVSGEWAMSDEEALDYLEIE